MNSFFAYAPISLAVWDRDLRCLWFNPSVHNQDIYRSGPVVGGHVTDLVDARHPEFVESTMAEVLESGVPLLGHALWPTPRAKRTAHYYWIAIVRLGGPDDRSVGACSLVVQVSGGRESGRMALLSEAESRIGTSLDPMVTSQELAETAVSNVADHVTVDLVDAVTLGKEPLEHLTSTDTSISGFYRGGVASLHGDLRESLWAPGTPVFVPPASPFTSVLSSRTSHFEPVLDTSRGTWLDNDPFRAGIIRRTGMHSLMIVPLQAHGTTLGIAQFWRYENPVPFSRADLVLAEALAARASVSLDNALRYTRERTAALAMQRDLMPHRLSGGSAVEVASRYLPADGGVGGDWVDVIPLSGARVALVVGDVLGHGINAAVTMGRLRAMVRALTKLEVPPDELLALMDELAVDIARDRFDDDSSTSSSMVWATCLYGVYDPSTRRLTMASAGHPPPAIVSPGGAVDFADVPPGAPLGVGMGSFGEAIEVELAEDSVIALYSDGLIETRDRDVDEGLERLRAALACPVPVLDDLCASVVATLVPHGPSDDDIALLLARTNASGD
ncbi:PP2C family protein-serine/threonine phosphatase [Streptomyces sp. NPDC102274]|uniref:PP2C family protein-serine/threonine phosphatase n=1 Tax=Streptomyces sp. NPDC102274 TaxID=3366151 RepID=UPI0038247DB5